MYSRTAPLLVTGMPRSGTTWLARLLSCAKGTALAGREPMNPRGSQYALGGSLQGWTRLDGLTRAQRRRLVTAYRGLNPMVYSRYGRRQWAAPLPTTRMIVKDPFALLSLPVLTSLTGARPIIVYRHPGAMLASFRRVGWTPNPAELQHVERAYPGLRPSPTATWSAGDLGKLGSVWSALYRMALEDLADLPSALVVSHEELAAAGVAGAQALYAECSLQWNERAARLFDSRPAATEDASALHNFNRAPSAVAVAWRDKVSEDEVAALEAGTGDVLAELEQRRVRPRP